MTSDNIEEIKADIAVEDACRIAEIYNYYVKNSVATFDTEEWSTEKMMDKIMAISSEFPYFVIRADENDTDIDTDKVSAHNTGKKGKIAGYCYVHPWKEKDAYKDTLESTIYISPEYTGKGIGKLLMNRLIETCRKRDIKVLIACITEGNEGSFILHEHLGFEKVSHFKKVGIKLGKWLDVVDYELIL